MPGSASASSPTAWSRPSVSTWGSWKRRPRRSRRPPSPRSRPAAGGTPDRPRTPALSPYDSSRRHAVRGRPPPGLHDPAEGGDARRQPEALRKAGQPAGTALAGGGPHGGTLQETSAPARHGARGLGHHGGQSVARGFALDEGRVFPSAAPRPKAPRRDPGKYHPRPAASASARRR